jgi:signal transduction histidine kinase
MEDILLEVNRFGFVEETHFTIAYSPVPDETAAGGIGGVLAIVNEISEKIVGERRVRALRDLAARPAEAKTAEDASAIAAATLAEHNRDVPFALVYLIDADGKCARLAGRAGADGCEGELCPEELDLSGRELNVWPVATVEQQQEILVVSDLQEKFQRLPAGPWADPSNAAAVVPIKSNIARQLAGFLIAGLSPRLRFDDVYRGFLELASAQIAIAIANTRAYEEERKRNEALAEIDRAKTTFFTNISHEFRTPLTLMLGPLEEALQVEGLPAYLYERLDLAHRNSLRLQKLVNALLDFSRIEAGRVQAVYEPADLATLTSELASVFRSAIERAGLRLAVDCAPLDEPVYIDREMWEKIVLNLLSNAFKFTLQGEIKVSLRRAGPAAVLQVSDTGCGIEPEELAHVFERFYRVKNPQGRSYEGSGIGLALVHELVRLNGGSIDVQSEPRRGTTFTVSIPFGRAHLPAERVSAARTAPSTSIDAEAYVQEAQRWLPGAQIPLDAEAAISPTAHNSYRSRIILADDNADMREYVRRLLAEAYDVEVVADGRAALEAAFRRRPDLVLADVMMPELDGFGLLKRLRADDRTASVPVIILSARAGEESRMEGATAGADDYLVKPFSARELLARVENHLTLSRLRRETEQRIRESEQRYRALVAASSDVVYRMNADWTEMRELHGRDFIADTAAPNRDWLEQYIHPEDRARVLAAIQQAIRTKGIFELEHRVLRVDGTLGWTSSRAIPLLGADGEIAEWFGAASDVTARKQAEEALVRSEKLASLGRLAATIAHEINNPLEAVTNLLYLAQNAGGLPVAARKHLEMADAELQRVAHIARQSLGFYREYNAPALTSVGTLLDSSIDLLRGKIAGKQAKVEKHCDKDVEILAVAGELRQVFSNLLANSLDAIDKGGTVKVRVSNCSQPRNFASPCVRITVADDGRGISRASLARIFDPFFTTKGSVGTGLGLWVTRQIIEKHGGNIQVRSCSEGARRGTVFSIVLPLRPDKVLREAAAD